MTYLTGFQQLSIGAVPESMNKPEYWKAQSRLGSRDQVNQYNIILILTPGSIQNLNS